MSHAAGELLNSVTSQPDPYPQVAQGCPKTCFPKCWPAYRYHQDRRCLQATVAVASVTGMQRRVCSFTFSTSSQLSPLALALRRPDADSRVIYPQQRSSWASLAQRVTAGESDTAPETQAGGRLRQATDSSSSRHCRCHSRQETDELQQHRSPLINGSFTDSS